MLVFTQFREATRPLAAFLGSVFGRPGLVLHGGTDVKARQALVRQLSQDLLEGGAELLLTEMKDDELLKLVALDLHAASEE